MVTQWRCSWGGWGASAKDGDLILQDGGLVRSGVGNIPLDVEWRVGCRPRPEAESD